MSITDESTPTKTASPVILDIVEGAIEDTIAEIEVYVERTARSTVVREQHDFRAAVFDKDARLLSHVSFTAEMTVLLKKWQGRINEGDVFVYNAVYTNDWEKEFGRYTGIQHLGDVCIVAPVFHEGEIVSFVQCFGHVQDIGGSVVGSLPWHTPDHGQTIWHEGLQIPPLKLYDRGELQWDLYELILTNSRVPKELKGDADAFVFAVRRATRRIAELFERYGKETVLAAYDALLERCARTIREEVLPQIADGEYVFEDFCDGDGILDIPGENKWDGDRPVKIRCKLIKQGQLFRVDFTGTDPQVPGSINWAGDERFYKKYIGAMFRLYFPELVVNEGVCDVVEIVLPRGTVMSPDAPASVANRWIPMVTLLTAYMGCLTQAANGESPAAFNFAIVAAFTWTDQDGQLQLFREIWGNGSGGRPFADGTDTVDMVPESRNYPMEFMESAYPIVMRERSLRIDSGGPGKHRGGLGYVEEWTFRESGTFQIGSTCARIPPWGCNGGKAGLGVKWILNPDTEREEQLYHFVENVEVKSGDTLRILGAGGGGWGDPLERDPEVVLLDVLQSKVSPDSARIDYGVVLDLDSESVEQADTEELREQLRAARGEFKMFDRGPGFVELMERFDISVEPGTY